MKKKCKKQNGNQVQTEKSREDKTTEKQTKKMMEGQKQ